MKIFLITHTAKSKVLFEGFRDDNVFYGPEALATITGALKSLGYRSEIFEGDKTLISALEMATQNLTPLKDFLVFNLAKGLQGEGRYTHIPGILEMLGIPYIGSSPTVMALCQNKVLAKTLLIQAGIPTPKFDICGSHEHVEHMKLPYPVVVKPCSEGFSLGMTIAHNEKELKEGVKKVLHDFHQPALVEEYIDGQEVTCAVLGNTPPEILPLVEIEMKGEELPDKIAHEAAKSKRDLIWKCPPDLDAKTGKKIQDIALAAYETLGCRDYARIDIRLDNDSNPYVLEANAMPDIEKAGAFAFAADKAGMAYPDLLQYLIAAAASRYDPHARG